MFKILDTSYHVNNYPNRFRYFLQSITINIFKENPKSREENQERKGKSVNNFCGDLKYHSSHLFLRNSFILRSHYEKSQATII